MFKTINELTPHYLHEFFESRSTGYNLRNSGHTLYVCQNHERTTVNEVLVIAVQCWGTSYRKMYEQHVHALLVNPKEQLTICSPYEMDSRTAIL
jgi:hypothetical protein